MLAKIVLAVGGECVNLLAAAMKRKQSASPSWLAIALIALAFAVIVAVVKKFTTPRESAAASSPVATAKVSSHGKHHSAKRRQAVKPVAHVEEVASPELSEIEPEQAETPAAEEPNPLEAWRVRSNAVWSLCEAATAGQLQTLQERINEGENVNARDEMGNTPLHLAAAAGQVHIVQALLKAGADPIATNKDGKRPAELAVDEASRAACEAGEQPRRREIALFDALRNGRVDELRSALEDGVNPNALSEDGQHSLLTSAAMEGRVEAARALLAAGADPRYVEPSSRSALNHAAGGGSVELVRLLIEAGADPMAHTNHGAYPIHDAIWSGRTAAAIALIPYYKEINYSPDGKGNGYPISMAIGRGNRDVVRAFLEAGLNPNDARFSKEPLLVQAVKKNDAAMVSMLLKAGADKTAKDAQGKCAADYATGDLAKLLN